MKKIMKKLHLELDQEELENMLYEGRSVEFRFPDLPDYVLVVERMR